MKTFRYYQHTLLVSSSSNLLLPISPIGAEGSGKIILTESTQDSILLCSLIILLLGLLLSAVQYIRVSDSKQGTKGV